MNEPKIVALSEVGVTLEAVRKEKHLYQKHIQEVTGFHLSTISKIENGSRKSQLEMVSKYAAAIGCKIYAVILPDGYDIKKLSFDK